MFTTVTNYLNKPIHGNLEVGFIKISSPVKIMTNEHLGSSKFPIILGKSCYTEYLIIYNRPVGQQYFRPGPSLYDFGPYLLIVCPNVFASGLICLSAYIPQRVSKLRMGV